MAYNKTGIISLAVMLMGHAPIQTLDNADDMVTAASQWFDVLLPKALSTCNWRFAIQIQQLSLSIQVPPPQTGFQNIYNLPSGYLKNIRIIPNNYQYEIYQNSQIWCNWGTSTPIYMEYAFMPALSELTASFVHYFAHEIACLLALNSAQKPDFFEALKREKELAWAIAAAADAQNRPQSSQVNIPVLDKRNVTGIVGNVVIG